MDTHVCVDMWRPEVTVGFLPNSFSISIFETETFTELKAHPFISSSQRLALRILPSPPPECWEYRSASPCLSFLCQCWGSELKSSYSHLLVWKAFCLLSHVPSTLKYFSKQTTKNVYYPTKSQASLCGMLHESSMPRCLPEVPRGGNHLSLLW